MILACGFVSIGLIACSKQNEMPVPKGTAPVTASSPTETPASTPSETPASTTWTGTYQGELPCADCDGIKTVLELKADNTYVLTETYEGRDGKPFVTKGKITIDGDKVTTHDKSENHQYLIENNQITALDMEGKKIDGEMASLYILKKVK